MIIRRIQNELHIKFDHLLDAKTELEKLQRKYGDAEVIIGRTVCSNCGGDVTPSDGDYLCMSGCGHVEGEEVQ